jgi:hypothetical protein
MANEPKPFDKTRIARGIEAVEATLVPAPLVAVTVKVYVVPTTNRFTNIGDALPYAVTAVPLPIGVAVTV